MPARPKRLAALASHADLSPRAAILTRIDRSTRRRAHSNSPLARKLAFAFCATV